MLRFLLGWLVLILLLLTSSQEGHANGYSNGYVADGYTYQNGYWYSGSQAYTRTQYWQPGYYRNCCYVQGYYFYKYTPYYAPQQTQVNYNDPGWRSKLLDIAANRDKTEGEIRKGAFEQAYFMQAVQGLGLQGNFNWQGYGIVPPYTAGGVYGSGGYGPYALHGQVHYGSNATTQYGMSYSSLAQIYGENNTAALFQMANQQVEGAGRLFGTGMQSFQSLVNVEGGNRARVAEIIARGQMLAAIAQAINAPTDPQVKSYSFSITPAGQIQKDDRNVPQADKAALLERWKVLVQDRCLACHNAQDKKGGFNIGEYPDMNAAQKDKVLLTLTSPDDKKAMPRDKDDPSKPGKRLTPDELRLFLVN